MSKSMFSRIFHLLVLSVLSLVLLGGCGGGSSGGGGGGGGGKDVDIAALEGDWKAESGSGSLTTEGHTANLKFISASTLIGNVSKLDKNVEVEVPYLAYEWEVVVEGEVIDTLQETGVDCGSVLLVPEGNNTWRARVTDNTTSNEVGILILRLRSEDRVGMELSGTMPEGRFEFKWEMSKVKK